VWALRDPNLIAIPKAAAESHVRENVRAAGLILNNDDLAVIAADFPAADQADPLGDALIFTGVG
jgi:diketogulonate reductase-like aldo/keto reductase